MHHFALEGGISRRRIADTVIFECIYVMTTQYKMSREYLIDVLTQFSRFKSVRLPAKSALLEGTRTLGQVSGDSLSPMHCISYLASH